MSESEIEDGESVEESEFDELFHVLKNQRRRKVIDTVAPASTIRLGPLAETVAAFENGCDVDEVTGSQRKRVYVALFQCHLPMMDDAGVIEFDKDRGSISKGPKFEQYVAVMGTAKQVYEDSRAAGQTRNAGSAIGWLRSLLH